MSNQVAETLISAATKQAVNNGAGYDCLVGCSSAVRELREFVAVRAARLNPVLLIGERGLRQAQLAAALHQSSFDQTAPLIRVNAYSLNADALHQLLFASKGIINTCRAGTLFINDLVTLPPLLQRRFAILIEETYLAKQTAESAKLRLIFATEDIPPKINAANRIAAALIEALRPNVVRLSPLRERREDIPHLARHLLTQITRWRAKGDFDLTPMAIEAFTRYAWPGNVDELEAVLECAVSFTPPQKIDEDKLPLYLRTATLSCLPPEGVDLPRCLEQFERRLIAQAMKQTNNVQIRAARLLGLSAQTLNVKLKQVAQPADAPCQRQDANC
jgi:DNA-binding NtrC family response regulator